MQSRPRIDGDHDSTCAGHKDAYRIVAHRMSEYYWKKTTRRTLQPFLIWIL